MNTQTRRGFFATMAAVAAGGWAVLAGRKAIGRPVPDVPPKSSNETLKEISRLLRKIGKAI